MQIVVDKLVSSCYTDDWNPVAVEAFRLLIQTKSGATMMQMLERQVHDSDSVLRKMIGIFAKH